MNFYDDRFDCDPADCNFAISSADTEYETADTATEVDDYVDVDVTESDAEQTEAADDFNVDYDPSDETAATDNDGYGVDFSETESDATDRTDLSNLYESSDTQDEQTSDCGCGDGCGCGYGKDGRDTNADTESADDNAFVDPSDETAAVNDYNDGCLHGDECSTTYAQKKCALDDYEIISDVLGCEKQLVKLYSTALCESAEEPLRNIIKENLIEAAADQYATFEFMEKRGMYNVEQADEKKVLEAKQCFCPLCD